MEGRFVILDCFRGLSAVFVVILHLNMLSGFSQMDFFRCAGTVAVPFFFTLSGFVIAYHYNIDYFDFKRFFAARFFRLFPLHVVMLCAVILVELLHVLSNFLGVHQYDVFSGAKGVSEIIPNLFLFQSVTTFTEPYSFNSVAWSLSCEFYTYMLFGLVCYFAHSCISRNVLFGLLLVFGVFGFCVGDVLIIRHEFTICIACFFSGCFACIAYEALRDVAMRARLGILLALEALSLALMYIISVYCAYYLTCLVFPFAILVFALTSNVRGIGYLIARFRPFEYLGKISYSIYMCHGLLRDILATILGIVDKVFHTSVRLGRIFEDQYRYYDFGSPVANSLAVMAFLCISIVIAHYSYVFIEERGQRFGRSFMSSASPRQ